MGSEHHVEKLSRRFYSKLRYVQSLKSGKMLRLTNAAAFAGKAWSCALETAKDGEEAGHTP